MSSLFVADIHQTDNPRDAYRWGLFAWLKEQAIKHRVDQIIFFGDLTEKKDRHRAELVTRLVAGFAELAEVCDIYIICGNHDRVDPNFPFFQFLCGFDRIHFFVEPTYLDLKVTNRTETCLFLPTADDYENEWKEVDWKRPRFVFMHQTVVGARFENGELSERGIPISLFSKCHPECEIWSGDIHTPQTLRCGAHGPYVRYVGAPYRIDFGDTFTPRVVLRTEGKTLDLHFPCCNKCLIDMTGDGEMIVSDSRIARGDLVKVRITLKRHELTSYSALRDAVLAWAGEWGAVVYGPTLKLVSDPAPRAPNTNVKVAQTTRNPQQALADFARREKISPDVAEIGAVLLENSQ